MPRRAYWKGHMRLSLVSFPVELYPAIDTTHEITLHQIARDTGERVRYQTIIPGSGPIEREDIAKGYEFERGKYVVLEPAELEKLKLESTHVIELVQFVPLNDIDPIFCDRPYFVVPDGKLADEAYRIVRDALRDTRKVALGQIVLSTRERIAAIKPCGRGLLLETLRYDDDIREASQYFDVVGEGKTEKQKLDLAKQLIEQLSAPFDASKFTDRYEEALQALVAEKLKGHKIKTPKPEQRGAEIINIMDALKRSVRSQTGGPRRAAASSKKTPAPKSNAKKKRAASRS